MIPRRSRTHPTPNGKAIALTPRDLAIFTALAEYRYLRSTYLHAFAGGKSATRFVERLGDLFHQGFIGRPEKQWDFAQARHRPVMHELARGARCALDEAGQEILPRTYLSATAHRQFGHAVMICESLASIELATRARSDLRFISWAEILRRAPAATRASPAPFRIPTGEGAVIPDGVFGLEYLSQGERTYRFFAVEVDRGTMPVERTDPRQSSYLAKLTGYREIVANHLAKRWWGISTLLVLTLTNSPERLRSVLQTSREKADSPHFLFKAADISAFTNPMSTLLTEPWERARLAPLSIGECNA